MPPKIPIYVSKVLDFYDRISTQWIVGFDGLVCLNYQSVIQMAEIFNFELSEFNMMVIQEIERFMIDRKRK